MSHPPSYHWPMNKEELAIACIMYVSEKENLELMLYPNFSTGQLPFSQTMHPDWFKLVT